MDTESEFLKQFKPPPFTPPKDAEIFKDIQYSTLGHIRQRLDLYLPLPRPQGSMPLLVYIHGGAFMFGSKESPLMPARLLPKGYALASLDYRLSGDAPFPASLEDCKSAVRWLRAHAAEYGLDADRFVAIGESAGGHQASMLGVTSFSDGFDVGDHLGVSSAVQGVVPYYGPSDFLQMDANAPQDGKSMKHDPPGSPESLYIGAPDGIQSVPEKVALANPITYISAGKKLPPFFIAHGVDDHIVPYHQSILLDEALKKAGFSVTLHPVEGTDHVFLGSTKEQSDELDRKTDEFLVSVFGS
ncbi:hypothetical protein VSDG_08907 [Cytospora chrysosperma]|uniref:BD-FAE-like domain-containing protein n=1 Tax=Cytospora chrysosperma TaxID=252740 RepID=A0A423VD36_CYTCH|nr:hypothetical protein VSDG_08907 [Valsa sordida]